MNALFLKINGALIFLLVIGLFMLSGCQSAKINPDADVRTPAAVTLNHRREPVRESLQDPYQSVRTIAPGRVIAIGDIHGDLSAAKEALRLANVIDTS